MKQGTEIVISKTGKLLKRSYYSDKQGYTIIGRCVEPEEDTTLISNRNSILRILNNQR